MQPKSKLENNFAVATFAAGCFWGVEELFRHEKGVKGTVVGYAGGHLLNPTYEEVCSDSTGHAEAVQITYDPEKISYKKLLKIFWENHDPTTPNRQGADVGSQYRSIIFYHNEAQKEVAIKSKKELITSGKYRNPVVTEIIPATDFYPAEEYHQQYFEKTGGACALLKTSSHHG